MKSSLAPQFQHSIKVEMSTCPASVIPTQLQPYHVCYKDLLSSQPTSEILQDARPDRHGQIERPKSTLDVKSDPGTGSQRPVVDRITDLLLPGEQGWRSGESTRLPPMWPGFDSRTRRHMWVEFVVGSRPCSMSCFSGYSGFSLSSKTNTSKFQFDLESVPN